MAELYMIWFDQCPERKYIGWTSRDTFKRFKEHCGSSKSCPKLREHMLKYGKNHAKYKVIARFNTNEEAKRAERLWVEVVKPFYNMAVGGGGGCSGELHWKWQENPTYGVHACDNLTEYRKRNNAARRSNPEQKALENEYCRQWHKKHREYEREKARSLLSGELEMWGKTHMVTARKTLNGVILYD